MKMAAGTGKTWVLQTLDYLATETPAERDDRFTRNFLVVAPGLIVYRIIRLLDAFMGGTGAAEFET